MGTDGIARNIKSLYAKVKSLEDSGISAYMLCGYYGMDSPTITGDVQGDLAFVDKIIGCKVAISDIRSSYPNAIDLARKARQVLVGGFLGKKKGVLHIHLGNLKSKTHKIFINKTDSVLAATDMAVSVSGTATLECLLNQVPPVVCYKTNFFNNFLLNQFLKTKYISLPNILAEQKLIPELRQGFVNVDQIEKELLNMSEATNLDRIKRKFHEIHNSLKVNQEDKFNCLFDLV